MGCVNVGLKGIADDYEHKFWKDAANFIRDCFYVDDGLCSVPSKELAVDLIKRMVSLCKEGGIELAKICVLDQQGPSVAGPKACRFKD